MSIVTFRAFLFVSKILCLRSASTSDCHFLCYNKLNIHFVPFYLTHKIDFLFQELILPNNLEAHKLYNFTLILECSLVSTVGYISSHFHNFECLNNQNLCFPHLLFLFCPFNLLLLIREWGFRDSNFLSV
jgi:hypothetical protein